MVNQTVELSVVLPAYNEGKKISRNVGRLKQAMDAMKMNYEILIVNDGSTDNTLIEAKRCEYENIKVYSYERNSGKGYAVNFGMRQARGEYRLFMDVDLSTCLEEIGNFLNVTRQGQADILIGTRKSKRHLQKIRQPSYRIFLGEVFTWLAGLCTGYPLSDFTCGFKMYTKKAADIIFPRQKIFHWAFDAELICIASLHRLRIKEIPVLWNNDPDTKVRLLHDSLTSLFGLFKIRWNVLRGFYR